MTVHTVTLEDQGKPAPTIGTNTSFRPRAQRRIHNQCQHEARKNGIIRQCRNKAVTVVDGTRLCWRHAQS